jgi:hypothetical protein
MVEKKILFDERGFAYLGKVEEVKPKEVKVEEVKEEKKVFNRKKK